MERRLVRATALCLVLALAITLLYALWPPAPPAAQPAPSLKSEPTHTLALLSSKTDPRSQGLYDGLEKWAKEENWSFVSYDCQGWSVSQKGQVEDLIRNEKADVAVLQPVGTQEELDSWVSLLYESGCQVITLGQAAGENAQSHVACHIGLDAKTLGEAVSAQLVPQYLGQRREVLLVADVPEDPSTQKALDALGNTALNVVEYGSCWGQSQYAQEYLSGALERHPYVAAVLCLSHPAALGAREALRLGGRGEETTILALDCGPELLEDVALGQVDAALAVPTSSVLEALTRAIEKAVGGDALEDVALTPVAVTQENVDTIDWGC